MDKTAKGLRMIGGMVLLGNMIVFFLPLVCMKQTGYEDQKYYLWNYVCGLFQKSLPHTESMVNYEMTVGRAALIIGAMILPVLLSLFCVVFNVIGSARQFMTPIGSFCVCIGFSVLCACLSSLLPEPGPDQTLQIGMTAIICVIISAVSAILGILALIMTPKMISDHGSDEIPQVSEIKQEQIRQAQYEILNQGSEKGQETVNQKDEVQTNGEQGTMMQGDKIQQAVAKVESMGARGVLIGLSGMYAGAEIEMQSGETIKFGRSTENDLIFDNQAKVSRQHCAIVWDSERKKYRFRDYSSGGTYLHGSEECLPQNIELWLEVGTVLDIGSADNQFLLG